MRGDLVWCALKGCSSVFCGHVHHRLVVLTNDSSDQTVTRMDVLDGATFYAK